MKEPKKEEPKEVNKYARFIVDIKGKPYTTVAGRVTEFWDYVKDNKIEEAGISTLIEYQDKLIKVQAVVKIGKWIATGNASETVGDGMINRTNALENCETSAVGRALGNMGFGLVGDGGVASADEMNNAIGKQEGRPATDKQKEYLKTLIQQKGKPMPDDEWFKELDAHTASQGIEKLLKEPSTLPAYPDDVINEHD